MNSGGQTVSVKIVNRPLKIFKGIHFTNQKSFSGFSGSYSAHQYTLIFIIIKPVITV